MTGQDLKNAILQAAIQGKLTEQKASEGDAADLYEQIQEEKARLINEGKIKKEKPLPDISEDEIPFDIPENWMWVRLGEIATYIQRGKSPIYSDIKKYPVVAQKCNQWSGFSLEKAKFIDPDTLEKYEPIRILLKDDLLWNSTGLGTVGRMAMYDPSKNPYELAVADSHVTVIRFDTSLVDPKYAYYYFAGPTVQSVIESKTEGSTKQKELYVDTIKKYEFPLPPLAEQQRIVDKIEELFAAVDRYGELQKKLADLTVSFPGELRESILQAAMQGKLTEQKASDGDAADLYEQIQEEKAKLIKEGKIKKEKPLPDISEDEIPFDIPENWLWVRLGDLVKMISDGTHKTPVYVSDGIPFLSVQNISHGYFDLTKIKYITPETHKELTKRCKPEIGDILICRIGTLGKAIKNTLPYEFSIFVSLGLLKFVNISIVDYVILCLNSPYGKKWIDTVKVGGGTHTNKINLESFPNFLVPLPPLAEQQRIVTKIEELFAVIDELEEKIKAF